MNIKDLQKHYGKLTIKERFSLLVAAGARNDDQERDALLRSAPRKVFSFPNTNGLSDAFEWAAMWHVMNQLGYAAIYYYFAIQDDEDFNFEGYTFNDFMTLVQRRILTGREAWRAVCKDYGIDPDIIVKELPYFEMIELTELTVKRATDNTPFELPELQETIDGLREVIEWKCRGWE